jgi:probable F420-dependent oxidoreductase
MGWQLTSSAMQIGVILPHTEIGGGPGAVRAYAGAVSDLGFAHIAAYDHVVGADPSVHRGWDGPYDIDTTFHEPMVLFGYLAAITSLELVSMIVILPQRQAALVAKQAAEIDLLSQGRLRLGVGLGWNELEYETLGQDFSNRGARIEEQVLLMRRLWTERSVTFAGTYERANGVGIAPLPVQRPIPVWLGGSAKAALRRAGRIADGWFPMVKPGPQLAQAAAIVRQAALEAGRDPDGVGMHGRIDVGADTSAETIAHGVDSWREAGATHLSLNTMRAGLRTVDDHIAALTSAAAVLFGSA